MPQQARTLRVPALLNSKCGFRKGRRMKRRRRSSIAEVRSSAGKGTGFFRRRPRQHDTLDARQCGALDEAIKTTPSSASVSLADRDIARYEKRQENSIAGFEEGRPRDFRRRALSRLQKGEGAKKTIKVRPRRAWMAGMRQIDFTHLKLLNEISTHL